MRRSSFVSIRTAVVLLTLLAHVTWVTSSTTPHDCVRQKQEGDGDGKGDGSVVPSENVWEVQVGPGSMQVTCFDRHFRDYAYAILQRSDDPVLSNPTCSERCLVKGFHEAPFMTVESTYRGYLQLEPTRSTSKEQETSRQRYEIKGEYLYLKDHPQFCFCKRPVVGESEVFKTYRSRLPSLSTLLSLPCFPVELKDEKARMKELMNTLKKNMQHQQALHEQYHHFETNIETPLKDLLSSSSSKVTSDTFPNVLQRFLEYLKEHHLLTFTSENILHLFTDIALTKTLYLSEIDVQLQELERYQRTLLPLHEFKTLQHENQHLKKKLHKYETFNTTHPTFLQKYHQLQHQLNQSHTQVVQLQETLKMKRMQHRRLQRTVTSLQTDLHQVSMALDQHPKKAIQPTPTCQDPTQLQQAMVELEKKVNQKENDLQSFAKQHEEMIRKIDTHYEQETKMLKAALAKAQSQSQSQHPCPSQETPESKKKLQQEEDQVTLLQQEHESLKKTSFTLKHKVKSLQTKLKTCHESKKEVLRYLLNTQFNNEDLNIHHPTPPF